MQPLSGRTVMQDFLDRHGEGVHHLAFHCNGAPWEQRLATFADRGFPQTQSTPDERAQTCAAFLHRAASWFHDQHGVTVRRVLTDNALVYRRSTAWRWTCNALQSKACLIKPRCPWTNYEAERFNQTLLTDWAYVRPCTAPPNATPPSTRSSTGNTRRGHTAAGGRPPVSRLAASSKSTTPQVNTTSG